MVSLIPINLSNPSETEELHQQRLICGWDHSPKTLSLWRKKQEAGLKSLFWITIKNGPTTTSEANASATKSIRAGHISLDAFADPPDAALANEDKTCLTIASFFILPQFRAAGLGRAVMGLLEDMATKPPYGSPGCEYVTLTALSKSHYYEESVEGEFLRASSPICTQEWYERLGYVVWKEEPRYPERLPDAREVVWRASFMRKKVAR